MRSREMGEEDLEEHVSVDPALRRPGPKLTVQMTRAKEQCVSDRGVSLGSSRDRY